MRICLSCGKPAGTAPSYHPECLAALFETERLPVVDIDLAELDQLALATVGRAALPGAQPKLSADLDVERCTLQVAAGGGHYLLKPQAGTFPHLPENEWLTQRLAAQVGLEISPCALVSLRDGSLAYVVRRFDRPVGGGKLAMEDFCQLAELPPGSKYDGTAERCGKLLRRHASEPLVELLKLFRQFVFNWWVGNGDLHLKNLALLRRPDGRIALSPAFDQLNTRLVLPDDPLAMPIDGKRDNLGPGSWARLAQNFGIGPKAATRVLREVAAALPGALRLVDAAPLPAELREAYAALLRERAPVGG